MGTVTINWTDTNELEVKYRVYRGDAYFDTASLPAFIAELTENTVTYTDTAVTTGQQYWYRVSAVFPNSVEVFSDAALFTAA